MPHILTTPPAAEPLTLAEARAHLRIGHNDEDALVSTLITAARWHVEAATGLRLITQAWSVFADNWPADRVLQLPLAPLIAVTDLKVYGDDDVAAAIDPAHYMVDRVSRPARLLLRPDRVWARPGRLANGIEVALTCGFGPEGTSVPPPLCEAMLKLLAHWFAHRGDDEGTRHVPPAVAALLAAYRGARL
jgi:uncharacterized phiE125 gp8 family phage protein